MAPRSSPTGRVTCATCEIEITGPAVDNAGRRYCCAGCLVGGPCTCSYDVEPESDGWVRDCLDVRAALAGSPFDRPRSSPVLGRRP
jgi:hypothetical protein